MGKRVSSFKKRTVTRWVLSYLFATLIPLVMVLIASIVTIYMNSSSMTYSNQITSSYAQSSFQDVMDKINEIKAEIVVDDDFDLVRPSKDLSEFTSLELYYRTSSIRRLEQSSSIIDHLFLFSPRYDWFISGENWGSISYIDFGSPRLSNALGDFKNLEAWGVGSEIWDVYMYDVSDNKILILLPMTYTRSTNQNDLCVGAVVSKTDIFPSDIDENHDVIIYSERRDCVVYSQSGNVPVGVRSESLAPLLPGTTTNLNGFMASVGENMTLGLKCIVMMDRSLYFHNYYLLIELLGAVIFVALAFGVLFASRIAKRDWTHYSNAAKASGVDLANVPSGANTYAPFVSSVQDLKVQQAELSDVISRQNASIIESSVKKLLDGDVSVTKESLEALGFSLVSDAFYVVIASSTSTDVGQYLQSKDPSALRIPFDSEYGKSFIVNTKVIDESQYVDTFMNLQKEGILDSFSVSLLHYGLESIRDCYIEAISVHEYQKDHDIPFLSYSALASTTRQNAYQFTLEENMMLQKAIKEGDAERAKAVMNKVIDRNRENGVSPKTLRFLLFSISGTIIRTINSLDDRFSEAVPEMNFPPILQSQNFQKSLAGVEEIIDSSCYSIAAVQAQYSDSTSETYQIYREVLGYIHENCSNPMMNVSSVADHFDISIAYLSRIFKKYHGINISEYITSYRLDKAKELLADGKMLNDVVNECGFGSLRTFMRVFKSVEGITPGQYKTSVTKEN